MKITKETIEAMDKFLVSTSNLLARWNHDQNDFDLVEDYPFENDFQSVLTGVSEWYLTQVKIREEQQKPTIEKILRKLQKENVISGYLVSHKPKTPEITDLHINVMFNGVKYNSNVPIWSDKLNDYYKMNSMIAEMLDEIHLEIKQAIIKGLKK